LSEPLRLFQDTQPGPALEDLGPTYVEVARAISAICATRILLMIAVVTGAAVWAFTVYDPQRDRIGAAVAYSLVYVLPQVALYLRKG
jgi:hypothetical protein